MRPKLAYVIGALNPGGTERLVCQMSRALIDRFDVSVFCLDEPGAWAADLRRFGVPVHCLWRQPGLDLAVAYRLAQAFRRLGVEIVHAHQCTPWFYGALSRVFYRAPKLVLQEHGRFYPEVDKPIRRAVNRLVITRLTHRFVAVSRDIRERLVTYEGLNRQEIEVVYNGVGPTPEVPDADRRQMRKEFGFADSDFVVGTVGRLDSIKNLPMFVDAVMSAADQDDSLRGWIVGDGPVYDEVAGRIRERGCPDRIRMAGYRRDVDRCLQCMDLFVLCSVSEGTSMALLEAMAAGIPVIVTAVGGNPEIVEDGRSGWVIPSGSVERLAARTRELAADRQAARLLGRSGQQRVAQLFTFNRMIEEYESIYTALLTSRMKAQARVPVSGKR